MTPGTILKGRCFWFVFPLVRSFFISFFLPSFFFLCFFQKVKKEKAAPVYSLGVPEGRVRCCLPWIVAHAHTAHAGQERWREYHADAAGWRAIQRVRWGVSGRWCATNGGWSRSRVPHSLRCRVSRSGAGEPCKEEGRRRSRGVPAEQGRDQRERRRQRYFQYSRLRRLACNGGANTMPGRVAWSPFAAQGGVSTTLGRLRC